jgi:hypothetical protein
MDHMPWLLLSGTRLGLRIWRRPLIDQPHAPGSLQPAQRGPHPAPPLLGDGAVVGEARGQARAHRLSAHMVVSVRPRRPLPLVLPLAVWRAQRWGAVELLRQLQRPLLLPLFANQTKCVSVLGFIHMIIC